jgi:hypothetical protein
LKLSNSSGILARRQRPCIRILGFRATGADFLPTAGSPLDKGNKKYYLRSHWCCEEGMIGQARRRRFGELNGPEGLTMRRRIHAVEAEPPSTSLARAGRTGVLQVMEYLAAALPFFFAPDVRRVP